MDPKLYIGSAEVESAVKDETTNLMKVTLIEPQGMLPVQEMTEGQYDALKSETPYEDSQVSMRKWKPTIAQVLQLFLDDNMQMVDKNFVLERVEESMNYNYRQAVCKLLGVTGQEQVSLRQIDDILKNS